MPFINSTSYDRAAQISYHVAALLWTNAILSNQSVQATILNTAVRFGFFWQIIYVSGVLIGLESGVTIETQWTVNAFMAIPNLFYHWTFVALEVMKLNAILQGKTKIWKRLFWIFAAGAFLSSIGIDICIASSAFNPAWTRSSGYQSFVCANVASSLKMLFHFLLGSLLILALRGYKLNPGLVDMANRYRYTAAIHIIYTIINTIVVITCFYTDTRLISTISTAGLMVVNFSVVWASYCKPPTGKNSPGSIKEASLKNPNVDEPVNLSTRKSSVLN